MKQFIFFSLIICIPFVMNGQAVKNVESIKLSNGIVERSITINSGRIYSAKLSLIERNHNFFSSESPEFSFIANGTTYDGRSGWDLVKSESTKDHKSEQAELRLKSTSGCPLDIVIKYILYSGSPAMRKSVLFINNSSLEVMIEAVDVEKLVLSYGGITFSSYGRQKHLDTYYGDADDALVMLHDYYLNGGILFANEAPGVIKGLACNTTMRDIAVGLSGQKARYPFRKWISPGKEWESPSVISMPYLQCSDPWQAMNTSFAEFQRNHSGYAIYQNPERRLTFMYNNYVPFNDGFNEKLILDLAEAAAECGIKEFTIDCGWYSCEHDTGRVQNWLNSCGDWFAHPKKFPNGMKPVFDRIRELGLRPGLWVSIATASEWAEVFRSYPQWRILDKDKNPTNLHELSPYLRTMCFGTDWKHYIKEKLVHMIEEWGISYLKLDLAAVTSAYVNEAEHSGCYATDHAHKDHQESYIVIYEELFKLFDELRAKYQSLYIDCTFETVGWMQGIDFAYCKHADGNWLTNFGEPYPTGNFRIRNLAWWRSPAMPASSMLIGNRCLDSAEAINELRTMIGTFPIMLGDLRSITPEQRAEIKRWSDWIVSLKEKYNYDMFRSDLPGFGEPSEGSWDAYARINTDTKRGGIIGIFRQGAPDSKRTVLIPGMQPDKKYMIKGDPSSNFEILYMTGKELAENGFIVSIPEKYAGRLFEIEMTDR